MIVIGRSLSHSPSRELCQRELACLGSQNNYPPWPVRWSSYSRRFFETLTTELSYAVSYLLAISWQASGVTQTDTSFFRFTNLVGTILLAWVVCQILHILYCNSNHDGEDGRNSRDTSITWSSAELAHAAINICLFPPLFFFCGLYYTDVLSALSVLLVYNYFLEKRHSAVIIAAGCFSLLFRQTNVLWVGVFLGGLAFCRAIPKGQQDSGLSNEPTFSDIFQASWRHASAYDPPIKEAFVEGCLTLSISAGQC